MKKGLLISGYHSLSQASWFDFLVGQTEHIKWRTIALPPRYFSWRMRGNPLSIGEVGSDKLDDQYDFIIATSSVDLATVQSIYPALRNVPSILYFHDNQFEYPQSENPQSVVDWQITNLYSALRADKLVFNSQYNQDSFLTGISKLMKKVPDLAPKNLAALFIKKSHIIPVPIKAISTKNTNEGNKKLRIIWNHRWEWDKNPELLAQIIKRLNNESHLVEFVITGQKFRNVPESFTRIKQNAHLIAHCEFVADQADYHALLASCDVVLSTAIHEFQGIAVLEAVAAGCVPLLPNRLSYPEIFAPQYLYDDNQKSLDAQAKSAVATIRSWLTNGLPTRPTVEHFYESNLLTQYNQLFMNISKIT